MNKIISYSHCDSKNMPLDVKLLYLFKGLRDGTFIELGANDGIKQSNTKMLEDFFGWKGLLIEPSPIAFAKLVKNRSNQNSYFNVCVSDKSGLVKGDFNTGSLMSSINGHRNEIENLIEVPCDTLDNLISKTSFTKIDLLSLDTEGHEYEVLRGLTKYRPKYLLIEIYAKDYSKILEYLEQNNYELVENFTNYNTVDNPYWDQTHNDYLFKDTI